MHSRPWGTSPYAPYVARACVPGKSCYVTGMSQDDPKSLSGVQPHPHRATVAPEPFILSHAGLVPAGTRVLDLACGGGRHGRWFLERGWAVSFLDRDISGVADLRGRDDVEILEADLETATGWPLGDRRFGGVIVVNYLWRPILADIVRAVAPGGALLYETFAIGNEAFGRPNNPDFLLREGELRGAAEPALRVVAAHHGPVGDPPRAVRQGLAAIRPGAG